MAITEAEYLAENPLSLYNPNNLNNPNITGWAKRARTDKFGEPDGTYDLFHPASGAYKPVPDGWEGPDYDPNAPLGTYDGTSGVGPNGPQPGDNPSDPVEDDLSGNLGDPDLAIPGNLIPNDGEEGGEPPWGMGPEPIVPPPVDPWTPPNGGGGGPTNDWPTYDDPPGYENVPPPAGDGSFAEGGPPADTSWDWNFFREKAPGDRQWGGYDEDYQAFERYQPGMDSPWGMPNIEGGNADFYQQQFVNQLRDEQGFRNRQRSSAMRAEEAAANPYEAPSADEMWSWANGGQGLPEVRMGTGQATPTQYEFDDQYAGMSLPDIWGQVQGKSAFNGSDSSKSQQDVLNNYFNNPDRTDFLGDKDFSSFSNAGEAFASIDPQSWQGMNRPAVAQEGLRTVLNQMYTPTATGPTAPVGYASPIQWGSGYQS